MPRATAATRLFPTAAAAPAAPSTAKPIAGSRNVQVFDGANVDWPGESAVAASPKTSEIAALPTVNRRRRRSAALPPITIDASASARNVNGDRAPDRANG